MAANRQQYIGLILAGGRGTRAGGADKGLLQYEGRALIEYSIDALHPFCDPIFINCNRSQEQYAQYGLPLIGDPDDSFPGPLRALAQLLPSLPAGNLITLPCDTPGITEQHIQQLIDASRQQPGAWVYISAGGRDHPLHALLPAELIPALIEHVNATGEVRLMRALAHFPHVSVELAEDPALNLNRPQGG
ncbi:molybdenum cofactor guanylyltransferase [Marinobacterium zhoushanense]|uniref:Molybdenum cofactor guanylyltransferase n=1 Tax=Marinobacterium zhoushanense TaxID=1679163 RepID=A0ABQ1KLA1_9GAMM|nr:molybdenum cofactor guanylyltransferase [Marinobacterium zhoushanense]GGC03760.1 molybdenum cofactor guanylyltransferase [Marinobacterium zhoushanense]